MEVEVWQIDDRISSMKEVDRSFADALGIEFPSREMNIFRGEMMGEHADIYVLHLFYGKNTKEKPHDFTNVPNNQTLKALVADILTDYLGYSEKRRRKIIRATLVPNADLYMNTERFKKDFSQAERDEFNTYRRTLDIDESLVEAAGPDFFHKNRHLNPEVTDDERLMVFISDLVEEREPGDLKLVDAISHIQDWKRKERSDLGDKYWNDELEFDKTTMRKLFPELIPTDFPELIKALALRKIENFSLT